MTDTPDFHADLCAEAFAVLQEMRTLRQQLAEQLAKRTMLPLPTLQASLEACSLTLQALETAQRLLSVAAFHQRVQEQGRAPDA